LNILFDTTVLV